MVPLLDVDEPEPELLDTVMSALDDTVLPSKVALRLRPTVPTVFPAVKVTAGPVVVFSWPRLLLWSDHWYDISEETQGPGLQVGSAENCCVLPTWTVGDCTFMVTLLRTMVAVVVIVIMADDSAVFPLREAFTKRPTVPVRVLEVKVTGLVLVEFREPMALFVIAQL